MHVTTLPFPFPRAPHESRARPRNAMGSAYEDDCIEHEFFTKDITRMQIFVRRGCVIFEAEHGQML